jgi:hypothetical protein
MSSNMSSSFPRDATTSAVAKAVFDKSGKRAEMIKAEMMKPEAKKTGVTVHYFDIHGRDECLRICLTHSGTEWQKKALGPTWGADKSKYPGGVVPCLELPDGTLIGETVPILRYLGRCHGYYPKDKLEAAKVDRIVEVWA